MTVQKGVISRTVVVQVLPYYCSTVQQHVHVHEHEGCSISIPASPPCCGAAFDIFGVAVSRQLAAVGRVILTWRARPARPSTRGALLLREYPRARPARPAHEREAALSGSRARPARPAHEREASLPPMAVTPEQGRQDRPMRGGASSPSSAPEQGRQGRRCEEWASV